jgi:peptide/nickel transport system substrate-binding protein
LVHAIYIKDDSTRALALQSGELDVAVKIVPKDLALFNGDSNYTVQAGSNLRTGFVRLNMNKPYMQDKNFRMALHYGIDTATYADKILGCEPANGPFSSILPFSAKAEMPYKYNPEEAKRLLDEAGYVDTDGDGIREYMGTNLNLVYLGRSDNGGDTVNVATAIQAQLKEVGIGVQLTLVENHADLRDAGKFDLFNDAWVTAPTGDPEYFLRASFMTDGYGNCAYYGDEKLDGYVEKLANTMAIDERYAIGTEAAEYLVEDVAAIFINYRQGTVITKSNVHGVHRFLSGIYCLDERVYMD